MFVAGYFVLFFAVPGDGGLLRGRILRTHVTCWFGAASLRLFFSARGAGLPFRWEALRTADPGHRQAGAARRRVERCLVLLTIALFPGGKTVLSAS